MALATVAGLLLLPLVAVMAVLIRLDSPGNPFFLQQRVGRHGKPFVMFKMRTLFVQHFGLFTDQEAPHPYRVTRVGRYLRRYKLDEIPQLLNILLGHMSVVGPRPDLPLHVQKYRASQHERLVVRPGLTGISQVSGNTALSWADRIVLDIWYVRRRSWSLDARIIVHTIITIIKGDTLRTDPFGLHAMLQHRKKERA